MTRYSDAYILDFYGKKLSKPEKEVVLRLTANARKTSGMHDESCGFGSAFAYRRSGDNRIAWGICYPGKRTIRGEFSE